MWGRGAAGWLESRGTSARRAAWVAREEVRVVGEKRGRGSEAKNVGVYGEKFRIMLALFAAPDGGRWSGLKMARATGGKVGDTYFSALRDGHVEIPGADKIEAIAGAMGFPPELWFRDVGWWRELLERRERGEDVAAEIVGEGAEELAERGGLISELLNRLFEAVPDEETGEPFTEAEVAARSRGRLSEEDVAAMREGRIVDPTWAQVLALCDVFGVDPSYWAQGALAWRPSAGVSRAFGEDQESYVTFRNSLNLSPRNRSMLRILSEHLKREERRGPEAGEEG